MSDEWDSCHSRTWSNLGEEEERKEGRDEGRGERRGERRKRAE
jgi:hypothetical protein